MCLAELELNHRLLINLPHTARIQPQCLPICRLCLGRSSTLNMHIIARTNVHPTRLIFSILTGRIDSRRTIISSPLSRPRRQIIVPRPRVIIVIVVCAGTALQPGIPKSLGEERTKNGEIHGCNPDHCFADAPAIDVYCRWLGPKCECGANDRGGDDEDAGAEEHGDYNFSVRRVMLVTFFRGNWVLDYREIDVLTRHNKGIGINSL